MDRLVILCTMFLLSALFAPIAVEGQVAPEDPADDTIVFRISVENSEDHVQTRGVLHFANELERRSHGRFRPEVYHSATLYRDRDVFRALAQGRVDMAVPGTWHISRFVPAVAAFLLPEFFGRDAEFVHQVSDGALGRVLSQRVEAALDVVVPGRWYDLGPAHLYFVDRSVTDHRQLRGLTVRVAGGRGNEMRIAALGGSPLSIAWGDLPEYLRSGAVDGVLTSHETVRSGQLWEYGITSGLEDHQYFPQYIPIIQRSFWDGLNQDDQLLISRVWEATVDRQRTEAADAQRRAQSILATRGITITSVPEREIATIRSRLKEQQETMAINLGIPADILENISELE